MQASLFRDLLNSSIPEGGIEPKKLSSNSRQAINHQVTDPDEDHGFGTQRGDIHVGSGFQISYPPPAGYPILARTRVFRGAFVKLFQICVAGSHLLFGNLLFVNNVGNGGFQEKERREFEGGSHGHADNLLVALGSADLENRIGHISEG